MSQVNVAMLKISDKQANYARKISAAMSEPQARKKGLINILGIVCAIDYFSTCGFKVNVSRSLHTIPEIFEEFKISDIYINNYRIDVITQFRGSKIKIPAAHYDYDCPPDYYVVVQLGSRLKDAKISGYFKSSEVAFLKPAGGYVCVDEIYLKSSSTLINELKKPACPKQIFGKHLDCMALFLRFIDKELASTNKKLLIQHLITCPACTRKLADVLEFNKTVKDIPNTPDIMQKYASNSVCIDNETYSVLQSAPYLEQTNDSFELDKDVEIPDNVQQGAFQNIIDNIFDSVPKIEPSKMSNRIGERKKKILITSVCIFVFLLVSVLIAFKSSTSEISSISDIDSAYSEDSGHDIDAQADFASSHSLPEEVYGLQGGTDYSVASQSTGEPLVATINKVSWEVPENLASKANYTRFLQLVGKNIKLNLQNDLLLSSDFAKNNVIKLNIRIASNGDVIGMKIIQSSGSSPIDEIIKKSVSETLSYMKPPSHGFISRPVDVTLVINL